MENLSAKHDVLTFIQWVKFEKGYSNQRELMFDMSEQGIEGKEIDDIISEWEDEYSMYCEEREFKDYNFDLF